MAAISPIRDSVPAGHQATGARHQPPSAAARSCPRTAQFIFLISFFDTTVTNLLLLALVEAKPDTPVRWERPSSYMQPIPPPIRNLRNTHVILQQSVVSAVQVSRKYASSQPTARLTPCTFAQRNPPRIPRIKTLVHHTEIKSTAFNFNVLTFKHQM
ncbi:hypothetical protein B0H14DRAFT_2615698 [Mycena olivaceomarginata]|nr:hypothetical protein B0H14DRAFT_2615698 [Mycena olivaceomarginata]